MTDTELLKEAIRDRGVSITYLASKLHLSRQSLYKKMNNITYFTSYEIAFLCELLGIKNLKDKERIFFAKDVTKTDNI